MECGNEDLWDMTATQLSDIVDAYESKRKAGSITPNEALRAELAEKLRNTLRRKWYY